MNPLPADWLRSPDDGQPLRWEGEGEAYVEPVSRRRFPFVLGVARLLPAQAMAAATEQHRSTGNSFDYHQHYQADAEAFDYAEAWRDPAAVHENRRLRETILRALPRDERPVLDVGCGSAWLAEALLPTGRPVVSMDISTVNPEGAVARFPADGHYGVVADAFHLPFRDGLFGAVVASEIIEHVPDPAGFLVSLLRVLAPGGVLVVTTPYNERLQYSLCIHCNRPTPHHAHLHSFTKDSLRAQLPQSVRSAARLTTFVNKALLHLRTHRLLSPLPYPAWRMVDRLAHLIIRKPVRLMLRVERPR